MRIRTLAVIAVMGFGLSGCSLWTKSDNNVDTAHSDATLRTTPQQAYQFDEQGYDANIHNAATDYTGYSQYAGYKVELFNTRPSYVQTTFSDPRLTEFVMLNGKSEPTDWRYCETINRGYLFISEEDFMLNPGFEVCMRNKGYVMTSEYAPGSKRILSAQTAGLRDSFPQPSYPQNSYPQNSYPQTSTGSAYFP